MNFAQTGEIVTDENNNCILLDSCSNVDIFSNDKLLSKFTTDPKDNLKLASNGGTMTSKTKGTFENYGQVWFNPNSLANILSLANVRKKYRVTMDTGPTDHDPKMIVHISDKTKLIFRELPNGLFGLSLPKSTSQPHTKICATTVSENESEFTKRDLKRAKLARELYKKLGRPGYQNFFRILDNNFIHDCPVTSEDARRALYVYGPDIATIKGRVTRKQPAHVFNRHLIPLPMHIRTWHRTVTLCVDIFYINGISFFLTTARQLRTITVQSMKSETYRELLRVLQTAIDRYQLRGFEIQHIHCDGQFECLQDSFQPINFNIAAPEQHVPKIERTVRTIKDDIRTTVHGLPFPYFTRLMTKACAKRHVQLRNAFPHKDSVANNISGHTILTGLPPLSYDDFKLEFGAYCQAHEHPRTSNNPTPRSVGAIALGPANNNGGWHFMSLVSGKRITRYDWDLLPTPLDVIQRVTQIAKQEKMPRIKNGLYFEWSPGNEIDEAPSPDNSDSLRYAQIQGASTLEDAENNNETIESSQSNISFKNDSSNDVVHATDVYDNDEFLSDDESHVNNQNTSTTGEEYAADIQNDNVNQTVNITGSGSSTSSINNNNYYSILRDNEDEDEHADNELEINADSFENDENERNEKDKFLMHNDDQAAIPETSESSENQRSDAAEHSSNQRSEHEDFDQIVADKGALDEATFGENENFQTTSGIRTNQRYNLRPRTKSTAGSNINAKNYLFATLKKK